jgi:hypothetical protein
VRDGDWLVNDILFYYIFIIQVNEPKRKSKTTGCNITFKVKENKPKHESICEPMMMMMMPDDDDDVQ